LRVVRSEKMAEARASKVYVKILGTVVRPKPGRSEATMWWACERRGARSRYWVEEERKPWRRRSVWREREPAER
jgi:hypothetical protein